MKLATWRDGSRDGQLVVVSRDLGSAHYATGIATRLQQVLDDWNFISPQLQDLYDALNNGRTRHAFAFDAAQCMAPLPRAYHWAIGAAYAPGDVGEPSITHGASDHLLGPTDDIVCATEDWGIDFGSQLAVIVEDVVMGASDGEALEAVRLLMLANEVVLREGLPASQSRPATAFSPVALTLDELGSAWQAGRVNLGLQTSWNKKRVGLVDCGPEMRHAFGQLIAHLAKTRPLRAGAIIGSGPVANQDVTRGYSSIADKRASELLADGEAKTPYLRFGDTLRIEMKGSDGQSLFGAIEQRVVPFVAA